MMFSTAAYRFKNSFQSNALLMMSSPFVLYRQETFANGLKSGSFSALSKESTLMGAWMLHQAVESD